MVATIDAAKSVFGKGISSFVSSTLGKVTIVGTTIAAIVAGIKLMDEELNLSYETSMKHTEDAISKFKNTKSEIDDVNSKVENYKTTLKNIGDSYNVDLSGVESIDGMIQRINATGQVSLIDQSELSKISLANSSLERTLKLKQQAYTLEQKAAADLAKETLSKETKNEAVNSERTLGMKYNEDYYNNMTNNSKYKYGDLLESVQTDIKAVDDYKKKIEKLNEEKTKAEISELDNSKKKSTPSLLSWIESKNKKSDKLQKEIDDYSATIDKIQSDVTSKETELSTLLSAFSIDGNGTEALSGYEKEFNAVKNALDSISSSTLSGSEKAISKLNSYFSSSSGSSMKQYLEDIVKNGGTAEEALEAFRASGMRLKDIGVSENAFVRYFEDIKKEAQEADEAVRSVDGTFDGLKKSFESENQGANYDTTMGYYKTAKEMYKNGLVGTDDFKSMAQFGVGYDIAKKLKDNADAYTYASDAYVEAWEQSQALLERWYGNEDELTNMTNVLNDFKDAGLASSLGDNEWTFKNDDGSMKFKTTAEAADKLNTSVSNVELAMSKLEEHGFEFDGIEKSGELLENYKNSLDQIKDVYDSMEDGAQKDRLKKLIEGYDSEYEKFQDDLSGLSEDQIVKIKFEYDLASIQQKIQELKSMAEASGSNQDQAALRVTQEQALGMLEGKTGVTKDSDEGYAQSYAKKTSLTKDMAGKSEEERAAINQEINALLELQNAFQQFKLDGGELDWNSFLDTPTATALFNDLIEKGTLTEKQIKELFGDSITCNIDAELNDDNLQKKLASLKTDEKITFEADVDDLDNAQVEAVKNQDGTIKYTANVAGVPKEVHKITEQDGTIRFTTEFDGSLDWINNNLKNGETITYKADVSGIQKDIEACKDENGTIHYYSVMDDGSKQELTQQTDKDGKITYIADTSAVEQATNETKNTVEKTNLKVGLTADPTDAYGVIASIKADAEKETIKLKGSVDLTNRSQVDAKKLKDVGWEDAGEGTATVFSSSYSNEKGDKTIVVTPILPNGDVLEPEALSNYAEGILAGQSDTEGIGIRTYIGDDSIAQSDRYAESLHKVQEAYYLGDDAQKEALGSLSQYNALQLKSIDTNNMQSTAMGKSMSDLMNSLGVGTDSLQEFVDVLTDMNLIDSGIDVSVNAEDNASEVINKVSQEEISDKIVTLVGEDNASDVIGVWNTLSPEPKFAELSADDQASVAVEIWNGLSADPKFTELSAEDQASLVVNLWNAMEANPKFSELSAEDRATAFVDAYNGLSIEDKHSLISQSGGEATAGAANSVSSAINAIPSSKTSTITTVYRTIKETISKGINTVKGFLGFGSVAGTAHLTGTAFAGGSYSDSSWINPKWQTKKSQVALVGEKSQELVVDPSSNSWYTVGDNGAEFRDIPKNAIIFNHKQTENLFKHGYINSRGMGTPDIPGAVAFASGTAYASGGRLPSSSSNSSSSSSKKKSSKSSSKSSSKNSSSSSSKSNSSSNSSNDKEETKETLDWIETKLDRIKRKIDELDTTASSTYRTWSKRNEALSSELSKVTEKISLQQQAYDRYIKEAESAGEGLSSDWIDKIQNGKIDIETITDSDLKEKISDYKNWYEKALDCRDAIIDLKEQESKLIEQRFNNIKDEYDAILKQFEHTQSMLESAIDITETSGYIVSTKYYDSLISNENEKINKLYAEREALVNSLNSALSSGKIDKYSESWYNMQNEIDSIDESIQDCNKSTIEWGNSIRQIQWDLFDKLQDRISKINDEADFLKELMSSEKMYDDKNGGQITEYGKATFGLHGVKHNTLMTQADEYRKEMEKIDEQLKSDPFNQTLIDRRSELLKLQQESISSAKQEKDAIKDLVEDGINSQLDALQKLIDKYTDLLDTNKDMYDYQKQLAEKQKEISSIEKQLAAYQGDTSEEGASKRQQLQNDLNDAKQDLAETQYERSIADQKKLLDDLYEQYEEVLNMRLDNIDVLVSDVIANVNSEAGAIRDTLEAKADSVGYTMTESMNTIWNSANQVITNYGTNFLSSITGVQNAINDLTNLIKQAVDASNKKASASSSSTKPSSSTSTPKPATPTPTPKPATTSSGDGVPNVGDAVTFNSGAYYYSSDGISPTGTQMHGQTVYITKINNASWAKKKYHISKDKNAAHPLGWVDLSQISGYEKGIKSVPKDEMAVVGEHKKPETIVLDDGSILTPLSKNSSVFNNDAHENLWSFANDPQRFIDSMIQNPPEVPNMFNEFATNQTNTVTINIPIENVSDYNDFVRQLQKDSKFEKMVQTMVLEPIAGNSTIGKYKQRF